MSAKDRRENAAALTVEFDQAFKARSFEEIAARLDAEDMVWAPVQTPAEVAADPQVLASGALVQVEDGHGGSYPSPAAPARFPGADATTRPASPKLGEHTRQVLAEIGLDQHEIDTAFARGAVA